jgi:hypothetical protein
MECDVTKLPKVRSSSIIGSRRSRWGADAVSVTLGKIIVLRIVSSALRTASVQMVAEDSQGFVAPIHIYHVPVKYGILELNDIYSKGSIFGE